MKSPLLLALAVLLALQDNGALWARDRPITCEEASIAIYGMAAVRDEGKSLKSAYHAINTTDKYNDDQKRALRGMAKIVHENPTLSPKALLKVAYASCPEDMRSETLGRLFYTARQRAALDANIRSESRQPEKPIPIPPSVTLNGVVTRSDGEQTVWIDGRAYHRTETGDLEVVTRPAEPGSAEIKVPGVPRRQEVRVGQRLDPVTGETFEAFEALPPETRLRRPASGDSQGAEPASSE